MTLDFSRRRMTPGNASIECFNGKFWAERMNQHMLKNSEDGVRECKVQRNGYNKI